MMQIHKEMLAVGWCLLVFVLPSSASTPQAFAGEQPATSTTAHEGAVEPLPVAEKMTLSEYFLKRLHSQMFGQVHQKHTLLTPQELARDFNDWNLSSHESRATKTYETSQKERPRASAAADASTANVPKPSAPQKPILNAIYSSSIAAITMNRPQEPSAVSSHGSRRVVPINWEDELTEWEPRPRRRPGNGPYHGPIFDGGGGGLDPSLMNKRPKYTQTSSFRRRQPSIDRSPEYFSAESRPKKESIEWSRQSSIDNDRTISTPHFGSVSHEHTTFDDHQIQTEKSHETSNPIEFSSKEPIPNSEGLIPHASPELRWEDGSLIDVNSPEFKKLGISIPKNPQSIGSTDFNKMPFLGSVVFGSIEVGKGVTHKDYKDPTKHIDISGDAPTVHHPSFEIYSKEHKKVGKKNTSFSSRSTENVPKPRDVISNHEDTSTGDHKKRDPYGYRNKFVKSSETPKVENEVHVAQESVESNKKSSKEQNRNKGIFNVSVYFDSAIEDGETMHDKSDERRDRRIKDPNPSHERTKHVARSYNKSDEKSKKDGKQSNLDGDVYSPPVYERKSKEERHKNHRYDPSAEKHENETGHNPLVTTEKTYYDISADREDRREHIKKEEITKRNDDSKESFNPYKGFKMYDHFPKSHRSESSETLSSKEAQLRPASRYKSQEISPEKISSLESPYYHTKYPGKSPDASGPRRRASPKSSNPPDSREQKTVDELSVHHMAGPPYHDAIPSDVVKALSHEQGPRVVTKVKPQEAPKVINSYELLDGDFIDDKSSFPYEERTRSKERKPPHSTFNGPRRKNRNKSRQKTDRNRKRPRNKLSSENHFGAVIEIFPQNQDFTPPDIKQIHAFDEIIYDINDDEFYHDIDGTENEPDFKKERGTKLRNSESDDDIGRHPNYDLPTSEEYFDKAFMEDPDDDYNDEYRKTDVINRARNRPNRSRQRRYHRGRARDYSHKRPLPLRPRAVAPSPPESPLLPPPRLPERVHTFNGLEIYRVPTSTKNEDLIAIKLNNKDNGSARTLLPDTMPPSYGPRPANLPLPRPEVFPHGASKLPRERRQGGLLSRRDFPLDRNSKVRQSGHESSQHFSPNLDRVDNFDYYYNGEGMRDSVINYNDDKGDRNANAASNSDARGWSLGGLLDLQLPGEIRQGVMRIFG
ncbi:uncharacterized protein LOC108679874 [Hyalella azteca]|uniref:Uncharacterized protein LOC108679874 n=1 Tax=Hyalella azteca TaxID=294128 RepID=A0A8B7PDC6_HYAAZ|nr:uncharacterized protein LOC108679874 [Hyalella azteca]